MKKFYIHTMGCKANQFESSIIAEDLVKNGLTPVKCIEDADYYILNSCTVTHKSDNEAMYLLRSAKNKKPGIINILTGCIAQTEKEKLINYDFIDYIVGNDEKLTLFETLHEKHDSKCIVSDIMERKVFTKVQLKDINKTRASVKIQDGCDNRCSYCIIPFARGKSRSADSDFVINQINYLSQHGFKEVVLTGFTLAYGEKNLGSIYWIF